jgi:2-oxoglutarate ferredoxin oxidoreductase subunit alpha
MDYSIKIGGEAGQGIQTIGDTLSRVFSRSGYHVFTNQDYDSCIRGGHNYYQIRFSENPVMAPREAVDIVVALDNESVVRHEQELTKNGLVIYDSSISKTKYEKAHFIDIPFVNLAVEHAGNKLMENTVATGAILGMLGMDLDILKGILRVAFSKKGDAVINANINTAMAGFDFAVNNCPSCSFTVAPRSKAKMLAGGSESLALGVLASGCKFYSAYPMTPSTGIMTYMAGKAKEYGIVVEQAEDEISAINMALGASFAGVRAMTGSSGGGFALMVEGISLAGMTEIPIVIALGQRPGPATGLPTRTEQGDLFFALHAGHGEFPKVLLAPGTPEQAFFLVNKAFDITEKYQIPVIILFDTYLSDTQWTCDGFDTLKLTYSDYRVRGETFKSLSNYNRFAYTETGVSPLAVPGQAKHVVVVDSDEHDEEGHIAEDAETRIKMIDKRLLKKMPLIRKEMEPPAFYGSENPETVVVCWGSMYGVVKEAVAGLSKTKSIAMLHFSELFPFPSTEKFDYMRVLRNAKRTICAELNATGQFARHLKAETGFECNIRINRFDGRPFSVEKMTGEINAHIG